jgi:hypothetical protein
MIPDMRPAVVHAIRSGMNRRGALAALLAAVPLASLGVEHASATRNQPQGKRTAKSERNRKKKARAGPAGPQGAQGPAGARGPAGEQGATGPKAITSPLVEHQLICRLPVLPWAYYCTVGCGAGETAISGGFESVQGVVVIHNSMQSPNGWVVGAINTTPQEISLIAKVHCLAI